MPGGRSVSGEGGAGGRASLPRCTGHPARPGSSGAGGAPLPQSQARWDGRAWRLLDQAAAEGGTIQPERSAAGLDRA
jgi:hypothetical protein